MSAPTRGSQDTRPVWIVVALLLLVATIAPLLIGTYDQESPTLGGFPFFYWYQFLLVPVAATLTYVAFKLSQGATARDRQRRGRPRPPEREDGDQP